MSAFKPTKDKRVLLIMTRRLLLDAKEAQGKGPSNYTCAPFVQRYNKLLDLVRAISPKTDSNWNLPSKIREAKAEDHLKKRRIMNGLIIRSIKLAALLETRREEVK